MSFARIPHKGLQHSIHLLCLLCGVFSVEEFEFSGLNGGRLSQVNCGRQGLHT